VRAVGVLPFSPELPAIGPAASPDPGPARAGRRPVRLDTGGSASTDIYDYARLRAGHRITGPAVIEVPTTTVVVPRGTTGTVDGFGNLNITREETTR
jgi:N-methylhydantoinase A